MYMKCLLKNLLFIVCFCSFQNIWSEQIGLLVVATGKYIQFVQPLIESAEHYFLPTHKRTYFIFTDHVDEVPKAENIIPVFKID